MKKVLFIVYQSPGGAIWVNETLRSAFGMYGEDLEPAILLMQDSVIALNKNTHPENLGLLSLTMTFKYLERYGTPVYAVKEDLEEKKRIFSAVIIPLSGIPYIYYSLSVSKPSCHSLN